MIKPFAFSAISLLSYFSLQASPSEVSKYESDELFRKSYEIVKIWGDNLISQQITTEHKALQGGLLCPACNRVHGRCMDAILPLMYLAETSGDTTYTNAAVSLMNWAENNVSTPDGGWLNDINVSDWNGTTVFAALALAEALHHHGELLPDSIRQNWWNRLEKAGEFIYNNDFIFSRRREGWRNMNVNYSASATYALYLLGTHLDRQDFVDKARIIGGDLRAYFTENDYFLFGEGPNIKAKTKNETLPVDLLYNVEESLPNMAFYAKMAEDDSLMMMIEKSMLTHLEFMLPDGAWDNSWGTRSFKWTYWGGRTSDGFMPGYYLLADKHPEILTAISKNVDLMAEATEEGSLYGGMHYLSNGQYPCNHHTFGHAKALAAFLQIYHPDYQGKNIILPREKQKGSKFFKDIRTWTIAHGDWHSTFTGYDSEYKVKGTHPMGGILSMLWNKNRGPVFAAGMNKYTLIEQPNMQADRQKVKMSPTPCIVYQEKGNRYTNLDDLDAVITHKETKEGDLYIVRNKLVDIQQSTPEKGIIEVESTYLFHKKGVTIKARVLNNETDVKLILPVISPNTESFLLNKNEIKIGPQDKQIIIKANTPISISETNENKRIFNFTPGFEFIPVQIDLTNKETKVEIHQ
ncbi:MAG: hypothetical protein ACRCX4_03680 [Bacteroidales bacterium]